MGFFDRARCIFSVDSDDGDHAAGLEFMEVAEIVNSISSSSNDWNKAAVSFAADHERIYNGKAEVVCYPSRIIGRPARFPTRTNSEWNMLALKLLENEKQSAQVEGYSCCIQRPS